MHSTYGIHIASEAASVIGHYLVMFLLLVGLLGAWSAAGVAQAQPLPRNVAAALTAAKIPPSAVAAVVQATDQAKPLLVHNAGVPMNPASTIKLVTTFAALELLGPNYTWKTSAWSTAPIVGDVLEGNLILKGGADPKFTFEHLDALLRNLRARGIREIRGDLLLDRSWIERVDHDPGRFDGEPMRAYNVTPDALLLNFKAFRFLFQPDLAARAVLMQTEPPSTALESVNRLKITEGPCHDWLSRVKIDLQQTSRPVKVAFTGSYPASCGEREWNVALLSHTEYFAGVFKKLWQELGGSFAGVVRDAPRIDGARLLASQDSLPLSRIVWDINKFSNNVMARQLFLTLSAELLAPPGRGDKSQSVVKTWLDKRRLGMPELVLENGSGLSREERISAASMARLLLAANQSEVMPELLTSLPLVAQDGTMRHRMKSDPVAGQAYIKTGSLTGVSTIAGFVTDVTGARKVVVLFINHPNAGAGRAAQDALIRWAFSPSGS
jgi:serine-type D-Ala-D-Ala carboxypeptidase/endopeptidase (penicillin-binding protein 4)